jgi:hypothetical protein
MVHNNEHCRQDRYGLNRMLYLHLDDIHNNANINSFT